MGAEALFRRGVACLADALFAERGFRVFFAKAFLAGFFIAASVDIASTERRKYRWGYSNCQVGRQSFRPSFRVADQD
jgi:hypothetical protein